MRARGQQGILVTGSLAWDHLMHCRTTFREQLATARSPLNITFHALALRRTFGGTAGNIAYHLRLLGERPILLAASGGDFEPYAAWLDQNEISREHVGVFPEVPTACAYTMIDGEGAQLTWFHPGAMGRAAELDPDGALERAGLAIVSPNAPEAMVSLAARLRRAGIPTLVDIGPVQPVLSTEEIIALMDGAAVFICNELEATALTARGLDPESIGSRVGAIVITRGAAGSSIMTRGRRAEIPAVRAPRVIDSIGCGDAYRAGLLWGMARGVALEEAVGLGSILGALAASSEGGQGTTADRDVLDAHCRRVLGRSLEELGASGRAARELQWPELPDC